MKHFIFILCSLIVFVGCKSGKWIEYTNESRLKQSISKTIKDCDLGNKYFISIDTTKPHFVKSCSCISSQKDSITEAGYGVIEINAFNAVNQKAVQGGVVFLTSNDSLRVFLHNGLSKSLVRNGKYTIVVRADGVLSGDAENVIVLQNRKTTVNFYLGSRLQF